MENNEETEIKTITPLEVLEQVAELSQIAGEFANRSQTLTKLLLQWLKEEKQAANEEASVNANKE